MSHTAANTSHVQNTEEYTSGYNWGYRYGYQQGHKDGRTSGYKIGVSKGCSNCATFDHGILSIALVTIGVVAAAGLLSGGVVGGCALGLAIPHAVSSIIKGGRSFKQTDRFQTKIVDLVIGLASIVLGSLAIAGVLPAASMGWCMVGLTLASITFAISAIYCGKQHEVKIEVKNDS